jgi:hypothetical protein
MTNDLQPDASGTVMISGNEELALSYDLKSNFVKTLQAELDEMKARLRSAAADVISRAGDGAKRVFFRNGKKGGVSVTQPDFTAVGNRMVLSEKKLSAVSKLGEISALGDVFEDTETEPGGEVIELRGTWVQWFKQHMPQYLQGNTPDLKYESRPRQFTRRLKPEAVAILRSMAAGGNDVAAALLSAGTKDMMVLPER